MIATSSASQTDRPKEACGLFGIYGHPYASMMTYRGLFAQQHRGQEGVGIVVSDGKDIRSAKGLGLVNDVINADVLKDLTGHLAVGHVRYSTTGASRVQNVQPLVAECVDGLWVLAHNGNLINASRLRRMYQESGAIFQTGTDSEVLIYLLSDPMFRTRPRRVARALAELDGAFAFVIMTKDCLMAARDPRGFKPLSIGRLGDGYVFASETCGLDQVGAEYVRDVEPGELVVVDETGLHSTMFADPAEFRPSQCIFEQVYFARPDSRVFGRVAHQVRSEYGSLLASEHPVEADIVTAIPDSGNSAALGYSRASGIPFDFGFIRNHYVGRTFIMPNQEERMSSADMKLAVIPDVVRGKRVVVVDDSIIRGTTARRRVMRLREAGATEVHFRVSCPPVKHPCFFGIDFPTEEELVSYNRTVAEICEVIGADSLGYLSVEGLLKPFEGSGGGFCAACFTGDYPADVTHMGGKNALESTSAELLLDL